MNKNPESSDISGPDDGSAHVVNESATNNDGTRYHQDYLVQVTQIPISIKTYVPNLLGLSSSLNSPNESNSQTPELNEQRNVTSGRQNEDQLPAIEQQMTGRLDDGSDQEPEALHLVESATSPRHYRNADERILDSETSTGKVEEYETWGMSALLRTSWTFGADLILLLVLIISMRGVFVDNQRFIFLTQLLAFLILIFLWRVFRTIAYLIAGKRVNFGILWLGAILGVSLGNMIAFVIISESEKGSVWSKVLAFTFGFLASFLLLYALLIFAKAVLIRFNKELLPQGKRLIIEFVIAASVISWAYFSISSLAPAPAMDLSMTGGLALFSRDPSVSANIHISPNIQGGSLSPNSVEISIDVPPGKEWALVASGRWLATTLTGDASLKNGQHILPLAQNSGFPVGAQDFDVLAFRSVDKSMVSKVGVVTWLAAGDKQTISGVGASKFGVNLVSPYGYNNSGKFTVAFAPVGCPEEINATLVSVYGTDTSGITGALNGWTVPANCRVDISGALLRGDFMQTFASHPIDDRLGIGWSAESVNKSVESAVEDQAKKSAEELKNGFMSIGAIHPGELTMAVRIFSADSPSIHESIAGKLTRSFAALGFGLALSVPVAERLLLHGVSGLFRRKELKP